jgi:hypothetical protein
VASGPAAPGGGKGVRDGVLNVEQGVKILISLHIRKMGFEQGV